jgi:hypothetical protein
LDQFLGSILGGATVAKNILLLGLVIGTLGLSACKKETSSSGFADNGGGGGGSGSVDAPGDPTSLSVSGLSDTSLNLNWVDNATNELLYVIERCTGSGCTGFAAISNSPRPANTTTLAVTGLVQATIYRFRVRAENSYGESAWLTTGDVTTNASTVSAPTSLVIGTKTSTSVQISWTDNATNETEYQVERCTGAGCTSFTPVTASPLGANATTHTESPLSASTVYRFRVRAASAVNQSTYLTSNDITTSPAAPTSLVTGTIGSSSIQFSWTNNHSDALINDIQMCAGAGCTGFADVAGSPISGALSTFTQTALAEDSIYRFRVRATNSNGSSVWLTTGDLTTLVAAPTGLMTSTPASSDLTLSWTDNSAIEVSYIVESCTGSGCSGFAAIAGSPFAANTNSVAVSALMANTIYRFRVRAVGILGISNNLTSTDVTMGPLAPTGFTPGAVTSASVPFTWTDNAANETSYQVERCTGAACSSGFAAIPGSPFVANTTSATDNTVAGSTTYRFRVRAVNASGTSDWLTSSDVTTPVAPVTAFACTSPHTTVVDRGTKGSVAAVARGIWSDTKYIPASNVSGVITLSAFVGVAHYDVGALALKYSFWDGSNFVTEIVAGDIAVNVTRVRLAYLSVGANLGKPLIFYTNGSANGGQIMMAVRSTASLSATGTWTVSAIDTTGGTANTGLEVSVSPVDSVALAYQASTAPAANNIRFIYCESASDCSNSANYVPMGSSNRLDNATNAIAGQIKLGVAWCQASAGVYSPAVSYGSGTNARYGVCLSGSNSLSTCTAPAGWTFAIMTGTPNTVVNSDLLIDAEVLNDLPKGLAKDATNVKFYRGATGCASVPALATTSGVALGSSMANTGSSFYKFLKYKTSPTTNERYYFTMNDATTDVKWFNSTTDNPAAAWNTQGFIQTVTLGTAGATYGGADINPVTGQIVSAYGTAAATFNTMLGVIDNFLNPGNSATAQVVHNIPVDNSGQMQLPATQVGNLGMAVTSTHRPAVAYVDFSAGAAASGRLKYAIRSSAVFSGSSWSIQTLPPVSATFSPQFPSIAFDNNNRPWIGYFEANTNRFILATNNQTDGSGVWTSYTFPNTAGSHGGPGAQPMANATAVAMSYVGGVASPVMIIADNGTTRQLRSARLNPATGVWTNNTQIATGASGFSHLTADFSTTANTIVISWLDYTLTRVRYGYTGNAGSTWPVVTNVSATGTGVGIGARIRLNPTNGRPAISYYDRGVGRVFYAPCANVAASCASGWSGTVSAALNGVGVTGLANTNDNILTTGLTFSAAGNAYLNYTSGVLDTGSIRMIDNVGGTMPSGLPTTVVAGSNGALSNAGAVNGGIPWTVQSERFGNGVLGLAYIAPGNYLGVTTCGD